jgi:hypothetical protein
MRQNIVNIYLLDHGVNQNIIASFHYYKSGVKFTILNRYGTLKVK